MWCPDVITRGLINERGGQNSQGQLQVARKIRPVIVSVEDGRGS